MAHDELKELLPETPANPQLRTHQHLAVFGENALGSIQRGRLGDRQQKDCPLESVRFQGRRDEDVGVHHEPQRNHPRLSFCARADLITWSICREVSLSVLFRRDSSQIAFSTSGAEAASLT